MKKLITAIVAAATLTMSASAADLNIGVAHGVKNGNYYLNFENQVERSLNEDTKLKLSSEVKLYLEQTADIEAKLGLKHLYADGFEFEAGVGYSAFNKFEKNKQTSVVGIDDLVETTSVNSDDFDMEKEAFVYINLKRQIYDEVKFGYEARIGEKRFSIEPKIEYQINKDLVIFAKYEYSDLRKGETETNDVTTINYEKNYNDFAVGINYAF